MINAIYMLFSETRQVLNGIPAFTARFVLWSEELHVVVSAAEELIKAAEQPRARIFKFDRNGQLTTIGSVKMPLSTFDRFNYADTGYLDYADALLEAFYQIEKARREEAVTVVIGESSHVATKPTVSQR